MANIRFCEECNISKKNTSIPVIFFKENSKEITENFFAGYIYGIQDSYWNNTDECPFCKHKTISLNINEDDIYTLFTVSNGNRQLLEAMIELHDKDIIEYELKMSQFRNQVEQQKSIQSQRQESSVPKCPHCHSTNIKPISGAERAASIIGFGIMSKKISKSFKCLNCKYTW